MEKNIIIISLEGLVADIYRINEEDTFRKNSFILRPDKYVGSIYFTEYKLERNKIYFYNKHTFIGVFYCNYNDVFINDYDEDTDNFERFINNIFRGD